MTQIQVTINDTQLQQQLSAIASRIDNLTPALRDVGEYMLRRTRKRFDTETAPDGNKWKALKPATIRAKQRRAKTGKPYRTNADPTAILKDTFTLRDSITYQLTNGGVAIGTNISYGIYQQPKRSFLGLDDADRSEILDIFADYITPA